MSIVGKVKALIKANETNRDILRYPTKIDPTASVFTSSGDLDKATDGDLSTYATGSKAAVTASAVGGAFVFDLGFIPTKPYALQIITGVTASAGNPSISTYQSVGGNYAEGNSMKTTLYTPSAPSTDAAKQTLPLCTIWTRYFKIAYLAGASQADITANLYSARLLGL